MFHIAEDREVKRGRTADVYFARARQILKSEGVYKRVKAEFILKQFPDGYDWGVLAGIEEAARCLEKVRVNVRAMQEGTIFDVRQPVMTIEGEYTEFAMYETALLGFLCQASGIATKAARCRKAAGEKMVVSFGARRIHPVISPMVERAAYIGGCDGIAGIKSSELLDIDPIGTVPHALVLLLGGSAEAMRSFHKVIDRKVKRIALVDTFGDEPAEALGAAEALGKDLFAVRLDTPRSRRGDMLRILKEVRWELDLRGFEEVKLFVSGGLDEDDILELNEAADGYGVGTAISNAPVLDFAMDIVEIEGEAVAKKGKESGSKVVLKCDHCGAAIVVAEKFKGKAKKVCKCRGDYDNLLKPMISEGHIKRKLHDAKHIRNYVLSQLGRYELC